MLGALRAETKHQGVQNIALARPVRPDHTGKIEERPHILLVYDRVSHTE